MSPPPALSVVIPTLDAAAMLGGLLAALDDARAAGLDLEVVVSDGGSRDDTAALAARHGARVTVGPAGRGQQLAAGADAAGGDWLLFLHADVLPGAGWVDAVRGFMAAPGNGARAAAFRFALGDESGAARRVERMVGWRCRVLALPYGDQGLLLSREFYRRLGGYRPIPIMEDVDMVRRIGRRRLAILDVPAVSSAVRFRRGGWVARPARNILCLALFLLGLPPRLIRGIYG